MITFIRHGESIANILKKKDDYIKRKIYNVNTIEYEKKQNIYNRLFDSFLSNNGIMECIKHKKITKSTILVSPLIRTLLTAFLMFDISNKFIIVEDFKEKYYTNDLLENYEFTYDEKKNDIKDNLKLHNIDINNIDIFFDNFIIEPCKNTYFDHDEYKNININYKYDINIKKIYYINRLDEIIKKYNINTDIYIITHWGIISSIFNTNNINNLDEFVYTHCSLNKI